ncbi:MAG: YaiI/YqxD family protein [Burkholderiales bacterium]|nr:YaiI/YqxD family protein [Burkholderiales bacterium]
MRVWVDADACPGVIKDILYRAAERAGFPLILVANRALQVPRSPWIRMIQVSRGFDVADNHIVADSSPGDLVITADIPLAAAVVGKAVSALNPRGELYTPDNVQGLLDMRNFMDSLRSSGVETGGPRALNSGDRQRFAGALERWISSLPAEDKNINKNK